MIYLEQVALSVFHEKEDTNLSGNLQICFYRNILSFQIPAEKSLDGIRKRGWY